MNTTLLKKNISNIILSKSNSDINFFTTKKSFLDKNFTSLNDVFLEINRISEQEFGIQTREVNLNTKKKKNNFIPFDNGIILINSFFAKLKKNCLIFFRLEKPILFNNNNSADIIFTLLTPNILKPLTNCKF